MSKSNGVLVFHRNCLFRDCLASYLTTEAGYVATPVNHNMIEDIDGQLRNGDSVLLLDLNLPDGLAIEIARLVQDGGLDLKLILLVPDERSRLIDCIAAGVHSCILEDSSLNDLTSAIRAVINGETYCSPDLIATMFTQLPGYRKPPQWSTRGTLPAVRLTPREEQVLCLLSHRKSNKQIAKELSVSVFTVKNHVHNILEKLRVESRMDAVEMARQQSWVSRF